MQKCMAFFILFCIRNIYVYLNVSKMLQMEKETKKLSPEEIKALKAIKQNKVTLQQIIIK